MLRTELKARVCLCERLVWLWRYRERYKAKDQIDTKAFLSIYSGVLEGKHLRQVPNTREPAELYCETV